MRHDVFSSAPGQFQEWDYYFDRLRDKVVYHSPAYLKVLEGTFGSECELFVWGNSDCFIYYPYLKKRLSDINGVTHFIADAEKLVDINSSWYYGGAFPNSPEAVSLFPGFLQAFGRFAEETGIVSEFIRFDANLKNHGFYPPEQVEYNRDTVYVDLRQSEADIWADFSGSNRRALRKAFNAGYIVREIGPEETVPWVTFYEIYHHEMQRKHAPVHLDFPLSFFQKIRDGLPGNACLLVLEKESVICGGFIVLFDSNYAFHFLSASLPEFWMDRINNLLFYKAIVWAKARGCSVFDFMGGRPGVFNFKCNFSTSRRKFFTYKYIHNPGVYESLTAGLRDSGKNPGMVGGGYFPAYREPDLGVKV